MKYLMRQMIVSYSLCMCVRARARLERGEGRGAVLRFLSIPRVKTIHLSLVLSAASPGSAVAAGPERLEHYDHGASV